MNVSMVGLSVLAVLLVAAQWTRVPSWSQAQKWRGRVLLAVLSWRIAVVSGLLVVGVMIWSNLHKGAEAAFALCFASAYCMYLACTRSEESESSEHSVSEHRFTS